MRRGHKTALRVLGFAAAGLAVLLGLIVGAGFLLGYTDWGRARLLAALLPTVQEQLTGRVRVGRLGGGLLDMLVLHDVVIEDPEGQEAVRVARLGLDYDLLSLLRRRIHIQSAEAQGLVLRARPLRDGRLNLLALKKPSTEPTPELRYAVIVDRLRIAGTARWELPAGGVTVGPIGPIGSVAGDLELDGALRLVHGVLEGSLQQLAVRVQAPLAATLSGRGGVRLAAGRLRIEDAALGLRTAAPELARLVPAAQPLELRGAVSVDLTARGPLDALHAELAAHLPRGEIGAQADVNVLAAAPVWRAQGAARELDPGALSARLPTAQVALVASGQGAGASGTIQLAHLQVELAGAWLKAQGQLGLDGSAELRAQASVPSLVALQPPVQSLASLRGASEPLPLSSLAGAVQASAHVVRTAEHLRLDADVAGSGLRAFGAGAAQLSASVHTIDRSGSARIDARGLRFGTWSLDTLRLQAEGTPRGGLLQLDGSGPQQARVALVVRGELRPLDAPRIGDALHARIERIELQRLGERWTLPQAATLQLEDGARLTGLRLVSGEQSLGLSARLVQSSKQVDAVLQGTNLDADRLARLLGRGGVVPSTRLALQARVQGSLGAPVGSLVLSGTSARMASHAVPAASHRLEARYADQRLSGSYGLSGEGATARAQFSVPLPPGGAQPISLRIDVQDLALRPLLPLLPETLAGLRGAVTASAELTGTLRRPVLRAELRAPTWSLDTLRGSATHLTARYGDGSASVEAAVQGATAAGRAAGAVELVLTVPIELDLTQPPAGLIDRARRDVPITGRLSLRGVDLGQIRRSVTAAALMPLSEGRLDGNVQLGGTLAAPTITTGLVGRELATPDLGPLALQLDLRFAQGKASCELSVWLKQALLLQAQGRTSLPWPRSIRELAQGLGELPLQVDAFVPAFPLSRLAQTAQLGGLLTASVGVRGTVARPVVRGQLSIKDMLAGSKKTDALSLRGNLGFADGTLTADVSARTSAAGSLALTARIPTAADRPLDLRLRADRFHIDYHATDGRSTVQLLRAALDADLKVTGTRARPDPSGYLKLRDGAFALSVDTTVYEGVQLSLQAARDRIQLSELRMSSTGGRLTASGEVTLAGSRFAGIQGKIVLDDFPATDRTSGFWLNTTRAGIQIDARADGKVLRGRITVPPESAVRMPKLAGKRSLIPLEPMKGVTYVDQQERVRKLAEQSKAEKDKDGFLPPQLALVVEAPGPIFIHSPELSTSAAASLKLQGPMDAVRISGTMETLGGWIELLGKRYTIDRARASFSGAPEPNPLLDVRVSRQAPEALIVVKVLGSAKEPKLELASEPPIYDASQIIAMVISGDPGSKQVSERSLDQKVVGAVSSFLVGQIRERLAQELPIDVLKVQLGDQGYTGLTGARVEVGKYLTDSLYLSYMHRFGSDTGTRRINKNEASLEYRFLRNFQIVTLFGDAGVGALDFYWLRRF